MQALHVKNICMLKMQNLHTYVISSNSQVNAILDSPFSCGAQCTVDPVVKREPHSIALPYTFALQVVYNMTSSTAFDQPSVPEPGPSSFENSCTGLGTFYSENAPEAGLSSTQSSPDTLVPTSGRNMQKGYLVGGYMFCDPGCYHNSKKDTHLRFYQFPSGARPEKVALKKKWISLISRQNFTPTSCHRVCSECNGVGTRPPAS